MRVEDLYEGVYLIWKGKGRGFEDVPEKVEKAIFLEGVRQVFSLYPPITGAFTLDEWSRLLDDASYWLIEEVIVSEKKSGKRRFYVYSSLEQLIRAYVLGNFILGSFRQKRAAKKNVYLRSKEAVIKKYSKNPYYLNAVRYARFLAERFGIRKHTRKIILEMAMKERLWPLCAWDIAMKRTGFYKPVENPQKLAEKVPDYLKEKIELFMFRTWQALEKKKETEKQGKSG